MSGFKMDYANVTLDENLTKYRISKHMGVKNLSVSNEFSAGKIDFNDGHITSTDSKDQVIYFDGQVNILQSAYTEDVDVIGTEKNTSFVDYRNLSRTYYTKVGGSSGEYVYKNNKCIDANNNLYVIFESDSDAVNIFDSTNNDVPVADLPTSGGGDFQDAVIVKYNHLGEYQWATHIGGNYAKYWPSLVCDHDGNVVVSFGNSNGGENPVLIYDTTNNYDPVETVTNTPDDSTIIVKYNSDGVFQWTIHVDGTYDGGSTVLPRISCDPSGNIFLAHTLYARQLKIYDKTPEEYIPLPDDFFCVFIDHFHTGHLRYTQPIFTFTTGLSVYNFVTIKFDKDGKLKWINHVEMPRSTDYEPQCFVDNDIDGNVILTGNFADSLKVFNPLNTFAVEKPDATLAAYDQSYGYDNMFVIKYNPNGSVVWCTKVATNDNSVVSCNTVTDSNNNIYLGVRSRDDPSYLFDTTDKTSPVYELNLKEGNRSFILVKYNKDGVIQWYTVTDGYGTKYNPCLAIDNRFIRGSENSNIYLAGEFFSDVNFYNGSDISHIAYTLHYDYVNESRNGFISCFDQDGKFSWVTKAATIGNNNDDSNIYDLVVAADKDGHVYLMGGYSESLNIYDAQHNDKPVATMTKANSEIYQADIFIIKYNRYGLLNTSNPKLLYIEDNCDLPDSFCKEVILTNNDHNGIVNLQILHKENYAYSVRRNVLITEAIELITKDCLWIPKIISDQYESVNDLDVIDTSTKTSFVNYQNLQNTFYTKVGGDGDDLNPQIYLDKNNNVYMAGVYDSSQLGIYDCTNNDEPVDSLTLDGTQSLFLTKYDPSGVNQWCTKIGGYDVKSEPSIYVNSSGEVFVAMQSYEDGDINIYDVNNKNYPAKTLIGLDGSANTLLVKYNTKGEFVWNIRIVSFDFPGIQSLTSSAVVTGDLQGNIFITGYFDGQSIAIVDTGSDENPQKVFSRLGEGGGGPGAFFICKFDYTGKYLWVNHLDGGLVPNNDVGPPPDLFKFFRINLNTDAIGNLYLTSNFYFLVDFYNPDGNQVENEFFGGNGSLGLFNVKYNSDGFFQWCNGISCDSIDYMFDGIVETTSCVDADGNLYVSFSNNYLYVYGIFDTRPVEQPVYVTENSSEHDSFVSAVKFNKNGVYQWNTFIKANENQSGADAIFLPVITCDNQYTVGKYNPNIYIHMNGYVDNYRSGFDFYSANSNTSVAYTLPSKDYWQEGTTTHAILSKFDANGNFQWATTAGAYSSDGPFDVSASNVQVDSFGHVYISGSYYDSLLRIWDVSTNGYYDNPVGYMQSIGNSDCFLIKYNRYGLINGSNRNPNVYIEDVPNIPDAFEKSIVITNNTNSGPINCLILQPNSSGFGYIARRTVTLVDCLDLVSNNGSWIPKVQADQISLSRDLDVIDVNTKLSILDYNDLNQTSFTTKIGGDGNEQNVRLSCDKYNNVYALCSFDSNTAYAYNLNGGSVEISAWSEYVDLALVKYTSIGYIDWALKIGFDSDFSGYPTISTDAEGNSLITIVKTNDGVDNNIYFFDVRNDSSPIKSTVLTNRGACLVKYDKDGIYQWDIRITARLYNSAGTLGTNAVVDKNGNVYIAGFVLDGHGINIWDTTGYIQDVITVDTVGMFVAKFDKSGKYVWSIPMYYGVNSEDVIALSCDIDGNIIVSTSQNDTVTVYERVGNANRYFADINRTDLAYLSVFMVKYDTDGKCLWTNRLGSSFGGGIGGESVLCSSTIDCYGNYYLACRVGGGDAWIFDTRNPTGYKYAIPIPTAATYNTFFAKYNKNGIVQWYNFVSGYSSTPSICVDNKFVQGIGENSVYLCGEFLGLTGGSVYLYNSGKDGDNPDSFASLSSNPNDAYIAKYFSDGYLSWCSKVGGSDAEVNNSIVATSDGHVYLGGEFNTSSINVYQGWTLGMDPNSAVATVISNTNTEGSTFDIFLVKYNRFGTVNGGDYRFGKEVYLENNYSIPDGTEKSIVITNNDEYNGFRENICLIILDYNNPGFSSFRNLWFSEGITLVSYGGQWFVKSSSNDTLPKRSIIMWGGDQTNIPRGWRLCDGGTLNGVTTPDLRGRFVLSYNNNAGGVNGSSASGGNTDTGTGARVGTTLCGTVGTTGGEVLHTTTNYEMPTHNHGGTTGEAGFGSSTVDAAVSLTTNPAVYGSGTHHHSISNDGGGQAHNNIPPYFVLAYIMKCF
jgi:microcystin-dependent protein